MLPEETSVVDLQLKTYGMKNVRIIDLLFHTSKFLRTQGTFHPPACWPVLLMLASQRSFMAWSSWVLIRNL